MTSLAMIVGLIPLMLAMGVGAHGNRDHTTVIHGAEKIAQEVVKNDSMRNTIDIIIKKINPS